MALSVFPERMNPINPEDVEASLRTLERYVQYMAERIEFALSKNFRTTTELGEAAEETAVSLEEAVESLRRIDEAVSGLADELEDKVDKVPGKGLSTEDYTTAEQTKLAGIEAGAEANVIETVKRNGTDLPVSGKAVDITVPTKVSDLTNDSGFQTAEEIADGYLPLTGGTLTGDVLMQKSIPRITMEAEEKPGVGRSRTVLYKNASKAADTGTQLVDYVWGDGGAANQRLLLRLRSASSQPKDKITLIDYAAGGSYSQYHLYGEHNLPTITDVTGLDTRLADIEARLSALES